MANGDFTLHNKFKDELAKGNVNLAADTFHVMLLSGWTPNIDTDNFWSDISANEVSLTGYTAGGATIGTITVTRDDANDRVLWDFADVVWASLAAGTVTRAAVVRWTGVASTSVIVGNIEITGSDPNGTDYTLQIGANGILIVT